MLLGRLNGIGRAVRSRLSHRAQSVIAAAAPTLCENLEGRLLMTADSWLVTWTGGTTPTVAILTAGQQQGQVNVNVYVDPNGSSVGSHPFNGTAGQDLIQLGSLTNFTVIDKVPANWKPQHIGGTPSDEQGIKVTGGGGGATLEIDATGFDNDTLFRVKDGNHIEATDRSDSTVLTGFSAFGSGVNHLVIKTNNLDATGFRLGGDPFHGDPSPEDVYNTDHAKWVQGEGTNVIIGALPQGIDVLVDSGSSGTFDRLVFGDNDSIIQQATVLTGAGNDLVNLQSPELSGGEGDDGCDVLVDYLYADSLGLGNMLTIRSKGTAHLDNAPGTGAGDHREYVDRVTVSGQDSANRGTLVVDHAATIDHVNRDAPETLLNGHWGDVTVDADHVTINSMFVDNDGELNAHAQAEIGNLRVHGTAFFSSDSAGSTIGTLDMRSSSTLNLDGSADLSVTTFTSQDNPTINAPNTSTLTIADATSSGTLTINLADEGAADVSVTGTYTLTGTLNVNDGILLTVGTFAASSGTVNVNENANMTVQNTSVINNLNVVGTGALATFQSSGTYITNLTITDAGKVTLQAINQAPSQSGVPHVLIVNNLNFGSFTSPTGTLDLTDGAMIVYSTSSDDVHSLLKSGYSGSQWNGLGINSSKAHDVKVNSSGNTALGHNIASSVPEVINSGTFGGITVDNTSAVIVRYTFYGDMNLDGGVDVTDLGALATNWQTSGPQVQWPEADFNYDNSVDVTDLGLLATNWQQGVTDPSSQSFQDAWDELTGG